MTEIERYLPDLHQSLTESSPDRASSLLKDIAHYFNGLQKTNIAFASSVFLNSDNGIIPFIKNTFNLNEFKSIRIQCLELILSLQEKLHSQIQPYAIDLLNACLSFFSRDNTARTRTLSLEIISKLIESYKEEEREKLKVTKLADTLITELATPSKLTSLVKQAIYYLTGLLAKHYPEYMFRYDQRLLGLYLRELKLQMTSRSKSPDFPVIVGCLKGLSCFLYSFTHGIHEDPQNCQEILDYTLKAISITDVKKYDIIKAGLELLRINSQQFGHLLYEKHAFYKELHQLSLHKNRDLRKLANLALEAFLWQISEILVEKAKTKDHKAECIFRYFIRDFQNNIELSKNTQEVFTSVKAYGVFALPCKYFMSSDDVKFMFINVLHKTELIFVGNSQLLEDKLQNLPPLIEALSSIVKQIDQIEESIIMSLERLVVLLMDNFPHLLPVYHYQCVKAILLMFFSLNGKGTIFKTALENVVFQALLRTCSHPLFIEAEDTQTIEKDPRKISYQDYMPLWINLLGGIGMKELNHLNISLDDRQTVTEMIYDEIISAVIRILTRLNLTFIKGDNSDLDAVGSTLENVIKDKYIQGNMSSAIELKSLKPEDFIIFINIVHFCEDLLPNHHNNFFEKWILTFGHEIIEFSIRDPYISGFYRLLAVCFEITSKLNCYKDFMSVPSVHNEISMEIDPANEEIIVSFHMFSKHIKEIISQLDDFRDELLASCLQMLMVIPPQIVFIHINLMINALQMSFRLGLSYLPLAVKGMDALEKWNRCLPPKTLEPFFPEILPSLNDYLKSTTNIQDQDLKLLQQRILLFLGSISTESLNYLAYNTPEKISQILIAWDSHKHLEFPIPFTDIKPSLYLDSFLPRTVELACTSGDRQTKVAACEFLHSAMLYMIGKGVQQSSALQQKYPMDKLYQHLFPAVIQLACDVDQVAKQLFEPFMYQLIHWFTSPQKNKSSEMAALLDALMNGLVNNSNPSIREFCVSSIKEFLKWTIKQSPLKHNETPVKMLFKRMYSFSLHPNPFYRLGAMMMFNSIYTIYREENDLVNTYTFEIVINFINCLAIAHTDEKAHGTTNQCIIALNHLERIIREKATLFNKHNKNRRIPNELHNNKLEGLVEWLLKQCSRPQDVCRHKCMELVCNLLPCVEGVTSSNDYFMKLHQNNPNYISSLFEGSVYDSEERISLHSLPKLFMTASETEQLSYFHLLLVALDCYIWIFNSNLLNPKSVFSGQSSDIFVCINFFLKHIELKQLMSSEKFSSQKKMDQFNNLKCSLIISSLRFISVVLGNDGNKGFKIFPENFWSSGMWDLIAHCLFLPSIIGFNIGDLEMIKKLSEVMGTFLRTMKMALPNDQWKELNQSFLNTFSSDELSFLWKENFSLLCKQECILSIIHTMNGLKLLHDCGISVVDLFAPVTDDYVSHFLNIIGNSICERRDGKHFVNSLLPVQRVLAKKLLEVAFLGEKMQSAFLKILLDETPVISSSAETSYAETKAELLFSLFPTSLSHYFSPNAMILIPKLISSEIKNGILLRILIIIADEIIKLRTLRKLFGSHFVTSVLKYFSVLIDESSSCLQSLLTLLLKLLLIDHKIVCNTSMDYFPDVFNFYCKLLKTPDISLLSQSQVLDLLSFFPDLEQNYRDQLKLCILEMSSKHFPLESSSLVEGTMKYDSYVCMFSKILNAMEISKSLLLMEFVMLTACRESHHACEEAIQASLTVFIKKCSLSDQVNALNSAYVSFKDENNLKNESRYAILERFFVTLLHNSTRAALITFYTKNINDIMAIIEEKLMKYPANKFEKTLYSKLGCFLLMEKLYNYLNKDDVASDNSEINKAFCKGRVVTGKELTQAITKISLLTRKENMVGEIEFLELRRRLHCSAHNTLIAVISCTQTEVKYFTTFLFTENPQKGDFLWDNIVDCKRTYDFDLEQDSYYKRKRHFVTIRKSVRNREMLHNSHENESTSSSIHYITSQYLSESSLNEEISQFDFSNTFKIASSFSTKREPNSSKQVGTNKTESHLEVIQDAFELELDELNKHECMASITALFKTMSELQLVPNSEERNNSVNDMPTWMNALHKKISDFSTHQNVKLFLAKIVINNEKIFKPFAKFWIAPLMELILSGHAGIAVNIFVTDLMVVMLSWTPIAIPEDSAMGCSLASHLLQFLMKNAAHDRRDIMRNNLEIIKTVVECWKPRLIISYSIIYDYLNKSSSHINSVCVGIQILGIFVINGLPPYSFIPEADENTFLTSLINNLSYNLKEIYLASAEVVGMILHYFSSTDESKESSYCKSVVSALERLHKTSKDNFLKVLHKIHLHYSPISTRFINMLLFMLPQLHGIFQLLCLEVLCDHAKSIENIFIELKTKNLLGLLSERYEDIQLVTLRLIYNIIEKLSIDDLLYVMPIISSLTKLPVKSRNIIYDICMWIYDNYRDDNTEQYKKLILVSKELLLKGLVDSKEDLRLKISNFWSSEPRLPSATSDRAVSILDTLYSPSTEQNFLSYGTFLLLEKASQSSDYNRKIFPLPLAECQFSDYEVNSSWHARYSAMTPAFVETLIFHQGSSFSLKSEEAFPQREIKATATNLDFVPTQEQYKQPYNWLTQSSLNTMVSNTYVTSAETQSSALLFKVPLPVKKSPRKFPPVGPEFGQRPKEETKNYEDASDTYNYQDIKKLSRRFLKDNQVLQKTFIRKAFQDKKLTEKSEILRIKKQPNEVTLYRKYRIGDLPDIEINHSALIVPLQALAQKDNIVASLLFSQLINGILTVVEQLRANNELDNLYSRITSYLNRIFEETTYFTPSLITCMLEIVYQNCNKIKINVDYITPACIASSLQSLGIVSVEELLGKTYNDEVPSKRTRRILPTTSEDLETWLRLAELYKSINYYDVVRGIFSIKFGTREINQLALEAEARNDYYNAFQYYIKAINCTDWPDGDPIDAEREYWDNALNKCYNCLLEWETLSENVLSSFTDEKNPDLQKFWSDSYLQEHSLPYFIRSKLKLLIKGCSDQSLLTFIDDTIADKNNPERLIFLENHYCEELALLFILQENYIRAAHYSTISLESFLHNWASDSVSDHVFRGCREKLLNLQKLSDIHRFLKYVNDSKGKGALYSAKNLVREWQMHFPDPLDSILLWDDVISNRCLFIDHLIQKQSKNNTLENSEVVSFSSELDTSKIELNLVFSKALLKQENLTVALKILKRIYSKIKQLKNNELFVKYTHIYVQTHQKRALKQEGVQKLTTLLDTWKQLDKIQNFDSLKNNFELRCNHSILISEKCELLAKIFKENPLLFEELDEEKKFFLKTHLPGNQISVTKILPLLLEMSFHERQDAVKYSSQDKNSLTSSDAHLSLALYCDKYLRASEEMETKDNLHHPSVKQMPAIVIETLLEAMRLHNVTARQYFPCLLQLAEIYPEIISQFSEKAKEVPVWMFLKWIGQMVALLDKPEAPAVQQILCSLSNVYPQAVVYPFTLSKTDFKYDGSIESQQRKKIIELLHSTLSKLHLVEKFVEELNKLTSVDSLFMDYCGSICKMLQNVKENQKEILRKYKEMWEDLFKPNDIQESYRREICKKFGPKVEEVFGINCKSLLNMSCQEFTEKYKKLALDMKCATPRLLKEYSKWLSNFNAVYYKEELEIPGQYSGDHKPLPEFHVKVAGFDQQILPLLLEMSFHERQDAVKYSSQDKNSLTSSDAHLSLALYCDKYLRASEEMETKDNLHHPSVKQMPAIVIETLLEAMRLHNVTARQYFPCLLQLAEIYPEIISQFSEKAKEVPVWMFLKWIGQMVALLDKPEAPAVQQILCSLSNVYPQAVVYPFTLSKTDFKYDGSIESQQRKKIIELLHSTLSKLHLVEKFVEELNKLTSVDSLFMDYCGSICKMLQNVKENQKEILRKYKEMWEDLFKPNDIQESYRREICKKFGPKVEEVFGINCKSLLNMSCQEFTEKYKKLALDMKCATPRLLKEYSKWLSNFNAVYYKEELEIPGQYSGDHKPLPEFHVKVAGFDQQLLILESLRRPKRIIIRGNNEKEFKFLVKEGEDLRLDQRIEQLFNIMNEIFVQDPFCSDRQLNLITYQVIPITHKYGILEWVDKTIPLGKFMESSMTPEELKFNSLEQNVPKNHCVKWLQKFSTNANISWAKMYENMYMKATRNEVISMHQKLVALVPKNLFKKAFMQICSSIEAYFTLRNNFLISYAVVCVSHYILGIGDRHLSNFMVCLKTGRIVGIDFGHSFGTATQFLSIPELMPFRLTNQLLKFMEPLGQASLLQPVMVYTLSALRKNPSILLNTMSVFIKEPSLDWQELAQRQLASGQGNEEESDLTWYPKQKIAVSQKKLEGWNSSYLTKDELMLGHSKKKVVNQMVKVCLGDQQHNVRATLSPQGLSPEQQVKCLIDQATDENILGRTWIGWFPWM